MSTASSQSFDALSPDPAAPNRSEIVSDRTSRRNARSKRVKRCIGIDIGSREVRVACLEFALGSETPDRWRTSHRFSVPEGELTPGLLAALPDWIASALPRCVDGESNTTAITLPMDWTHYQIVGGSELASSKQRCDEMFTASAFRSDSHLCHWPVVGVHHGRPSLEDQYVISAISTRFVCEVAHAISTAGYRIASVIPHGVALAHAAPRLTGIQPQLIVWLGREAALVAVRHQSGVGLVRVLPAVPRSILEAECEDRPLDRFALRPYLADIANELSSTIRYAARVDMNQPSNDPILLCGPIAEIGGVEETIAKIASAPVAVWRYHGTERPTPTYAASTQPIETRQRVDARYATALSLAFAANRCGKRGYAK